jgi:formylglycine-generating enzyme required for sulfatase activity
LNKAIAKYFVKGWFIIIFSFFAYTFVANAQTNTKNLRSLKVMALIPEGIFTMGSNAGPDDEKPEHTVFLKAFYLDILPVTNSDFAKFLNSQGVQNQKGETFYDHDDNDAKIHQHNSMWQADIAYSSHPVNEVSWLGAREYCTWLNKRLPTEAEWEKAARGIDKRKYPWGNEAPNTRLAFLEPHLTHLHRLMDFQMEQAHMEF